MKYFFLLAVVIMSTAGCNTCVTGTGDSQPEDRLLPDFHEIEIKCGADVVLREKSPEEKTRIVVEAQPNILPLVTSRVKGEVLVIDMEGCMSTEKPVMIYIYASGIHKILNDGSGNVSANNMLNADEFEIELEGSGNIQLDVKTNKMKIHQHGSGKIKVGGNANLVEVMSKGSGDVDALALLGDEAEVNLMGSGAVSVFATKEMDLVLRGSGSIYYGGKPEELNTKDDGSGEIHEAQ